jgi:hypothetical protein
VKSLLIEHSNFSEKVRRSYREEFKMRTDVLEQIYRLEMEIKNLKAQDKLMAEEIKNLRARDKFNVNV